MRRIIKKGVVYLIISCAVIAIYFAAVFVVHGLFQEIPNLTDFWTAGVIAAIGILTIPLTVKYIGKITDKLFFKNRADYLSELEEQVRQRTAELQQLQEEQCRMIMDISHGLQTPLTVVKGELEFLKKHSRSHKKFAAAEHSIDAVSHFIYDLLKLTRLEMNCNNFQKTPVDMSDLLNEIIEYVTVISKNNGIVLTSDISPQIKIIGGKEKLQELVNNLASNAIKYMGNAKNKNVHIALRRKYGSAELIVKDSGVGVSEEDLPLIFERFYRVKNQSNAQGTGLGLAISKKIVEMHDGTIGATSRLGRGTIFTVRLPLAPNDG